jgi:hypothetical protein
VNLGSTPTWRGKFTVTDAGIDATKKVMLWQAPGPYTGKGSALSADEGAMDPIHISAVIPAAGSAVVHWETVLGLSDVRDNAALPADTSTAQPNNERASTNLSQHADHPVARVIAKRVGLVKGNVKFSYVTFG